MNSRDAVTSLTANGIYLLMEQSKKNMVVLQILEPEVIQTQKTETKSLKFKILISDGRAKYKAVLGNDAALLYEQIGTPKFAVVRVNDFMMPQQQMKKLILLTKIEMLYKDIQETIGTPIDYQEYCDQETFKKPVSVPIPSKYLAQIKPSNPVPTSTNKTSEFSNGNSRPVNQTLSMAPNQAASSTYNNYNQQRSSGGVQQFQSTNVNTNVNKFSGNQNFNNQPKQNQQSKPFAPKSSGPIAYANNNPNIANIADDEFMNFKQLAPFSPFTIKARITQKSDLKTFTKANGDNHVFSIEMVDREGNEMSASFFGNAAEAFYNVIEEGKVYAMMGGGTVKMANQKYNRTKSEYQIVFERVDASITLCEDSGDIQMAKFEFIQLAEVLNRAIGDNVDVACFIKDCGSITEVPLKAGGSKERRVVQVYDDSKVVMEMTLWGQNATQFNYRNDDLILIKGAKIAEFSSKKNLSNTYSTKLIGDLSQVSSDVRIKDLIEWRKSGYKADELEVVGGSGGGSDTGFMRNPYTIDEILAEAQNLSGDSKGYYDCRVYVQHVKTEGTLYYAACQNVGSCGRKVNQNPNDGTWTCSNCNNQFSNPTYRYTLNTKIADTTNNMWISAFDKIGQTILERDADDVRRMKEQTDENAIQELFKAAHNKEYNVRIMAKPDNYGGEARTRYQIIRIKPINYAEDSRNIMNLLQEYGKIGSE